MSDRTKTPSQPGRRAPLRKCPHCSSMHLATIKYCPTTGAEIDPPNITRPPEDDKHSSGKNWAQWLKERWYIPAGILLLLLFLSLTFLMIHHKTELRSIPPADSGSVQANFGGSVPIRTLTGNNRRVWIDKFEVSIQEYRDVMGRVPSQPAGFNNDHPVVNISYKDAQAYAEKVGKRLCSEQEWEAAAGVLDGQHPDLRLAVISRGLAPEGKPSTPQDRRFLMDKSDVGAFNLLGNVKEWIAPSPSGEPRYIGAAWHDNADSLGEAFRAQTNSGGAPAEDIGFRCCTEKRP